MEMARVMVQYDFMVMAPEIGSRTHAFSGRDCGLVSSLLGRKVEEINERIRLQKPDTNMSLDVDMFTLVH